MFASTQTYATLPASDIERAKSYYADKLGLKPTEERPDGLLYDCGNGAKFCLYPSGGSASGNHTQLSFQVDSIDNTVSELRGDGVVFEEYDMPGIKTTNGVASLGEIRGAWFKDSEGNIIGLVEYK